MIIINHRCTVSDFFVDVDLKIEKEIGGTKDNVGKFYLNNSSLDGTQSVLLFTRDIIAEFR